MCTILYTQEISVYFRSQLPSQSTVYNDIFHQCGPPLFLTMSSDQDYLSLAWVISNCGGDVTPRSVRRVLITFRKLCKRVTESQKSWPLDSVDEIVMGFDGCYRDSIGWGVFLGFILWLLIFRMNLMTRSAQWQSRPLLLGVAGLIPERNKYFLRKKMHDTCIYTCFIPFLLFFFYYYLLVMVHNQHWSDRLN